MTWELHQALQLIGFNNRSSRISPVCGLLPFFQHLNSTRNLVLATQELRTG
jgi:hypothetical protein